MTLSVPKVPSFSHLLREQSPPGEIPICVLRGVRLEDSKVEGSEEQVFLLSGECFCVRMGDRDRQVDVTQIK